MRVLIAGCGYVGTELGRRLVDRGHEVWGLRRDPSRLPPGIRPLRKDLLDPPVGEPLPAVDQVVYAASANASTPEGYRRIYVDGVRNLLEELPSRSKIARFLFVSSTGVYGDTAGDWVDESSPTEPTSFRGGVMLEGERTALSSAIPTTVLRLGGIYGPGRTRLLERVREGTARCPDPGPVWSNRIHRDDAARALEHLLDLPRPGSIYLGVDDHPAPLCEVYHTLAVLLDAPEPRRDPEASRSRANKRCSNRRLRASGFRFVYPSFEDGYRAMIDASSGDSKPRV